MQCLVFSFSFLLSSPLIYLKHRFQLFFTLLFFSNIWVLLPLVRFDFNPHTLGVFFIVSVAHSSPLWWLV